MTLDSLFAEIARANWRVTNLYQSPTGLWRVNLRLDVEGGAEYGDWAEAGTLEDALFDAMGKMADREFAPDVETKASIDTSPRPSLLTALGLARPTPIINRRI